ncbi:hypothetical protein LIER_40174 [Lithospermum erythrorhizon]|uniref:CCHC-type domain-containing protein n=1 Tax=Lithospermum erythrorhizon TaxID=34254 RepID=A0AAV3QTQ6_LITER
MTTDDLRSTLIMHEQKFNRKKKAEEDQVLKVEERSFGRGRGRRLFRGRGRGRQSFSKATVECYKCHNLGHFQYECPKWEKEANYAVATEEEDDLLLMVQTNGDALNDKDTWYIDSGYSNHMCNKEGLFSSIDKDISHFVKLGNNTRMQVAGRGTMKISLSGD